jgi:hypothetical protein
MLHIASCVERSSVGITLLHEGGKCALTGVEMPKLGRG